MLLAVFMAWSGCTNPATGDRPCASEVLLALEIEGFADPLGDAMLRGGSKVHSHNSTCGDEAHKHDQKVRPVNASTSRGSVAVGEYQELRLVVGTRLLRVQAEVPVVDATTVKIRNGTQLQLFINGNATPIQAIEWLPSPGALQGMLINENLDVPFQEVSIRIPVNSTWNEGLLSGFVLYHSIADPHRKGEAGFLAFITLTNPDGIVLFNRSLANWGDHGELTMRPLATGVWTLRIFTNATSEDTGVVSFAGAFQY
jgi:hypothetical protein